MANFIELREVNKLIKEKFYIPTYQRGYRWDRRQVVDLLEDVYEFMGNANIQNGEFYCLQPIVVKKREDGRFDVIDGQQRLTTIMIIQKYLEKRTYSIEYASRIGSADYLNNIEQYFENQDESNTQKNIDFFFMANAYKYVKEWFEKIVEEQEEYSLPDEFSTYLLKYCKVIWYEVDDEADAETIFTRLNIGKIPLTNAELIKALFLKKGNFEEIGDTAYLRQLEIASEWDLIENSLQDDRVWFFINPSYVKQPDTRIEYIFDIMVGKSKVGDNYTFIKFAEKLEKKTIFEVWKEIKDYYRTIMEWYNDQILYHLIGFLTSSNVDITVSDLLAKYFIEDYKKNEFVAYVKSLIKEYFNNTGLDDLSYEVSRDKVMMRDVLLLFNVITVMNKCSSYSRFPFDSYNKNKWSLEHIHAQNAEGLGNSKELMIAWIDEHLASFRQFNKETYKDVVSKLEKFNREDFTYEDFQNLFTEISVMIQDDYGIELHNLDNLALLDRDANSSINNSFFDVKRHMIIEKDRCGEFIPVCTRNVFLKYYSSDPSQIQYWSNQDREDYISAIKNMLVEYLPEEDSND